MTNSLSCASCIVLLASIDPISPCPPSQAIRIAQVKPNLRRPRPLMHSTLCAQVLEEVPLHTRINPTPEDPPDAVLLAHPGQRQLLVYRISRAAKVVVLDAIGQGLPPPRAGNHKSSPNHSEIPAVFLSPHTRFRRRTWYWADVVLPSRSPYMSITLSGHRLLLHLCMAITRKIVITTTQP